MRKGKNRTRRENLKNGLLFTSPAIIGLLCLTAYPVIASLFYSFCNYSALKPPHWAGLANYKHMMHDAQLFRSMVNTAVYAIFSVPIGVVVAFILALLLNAKVKGLTIFRTLFYLPTIVPLVASSVLWLWILNPDYGLINTVITILSHGHVQGPGWMADPRWSKPGLILMGTWGVGGWMVIFLAGLQGVPKEIYEAAELDGASSWQNVKNVTIPFMSPYIFFAIVMGLIGASQYFTQAYVMTGGQGSPADSTLFFAMYLFQNAFHFFKMGYACAMAWVLFIVILGATLLLFKSSARYVYYGDK